MLSSVENNPINNEQSSVTNISALARVDYILRFSKHAALVIDENYDLTSDIGHQYIAQLAPQDNTAFVSISNKLNDIQIRCRIIEQLFVGEVFDPEVSLAVSLINLVKQSPQKLNIVIGNAHNLSLQLIHELCQLTEVAKKSNLALSVLMLALPSAGITVAQHRDLFHKKITIVSAQSGQLISLNSPLFKVKSDWFKFTLAKKWLLVFSVLSILSLVTIYILMNLDSLFFSNKNLQSTLTSNSPSQISTNLLTKENSINNSNFVQEKELASTDDILAAIYNVNTKSTSSDEVIKEASTDDILSAISLQKVNVQPENLENKDIELHKTIELFDNTKSLTPQVSDTVNGAYYLAKQQGFVIQIVGFSDAERVSQFKQEHYDVNVYVYQRLLSGLENWVITSEVYANKEQARVALENMPDSLKAMSPWIKSLSNIQAEVNAFNAL